MNTNLQDKIVEETNAAEEVSDDKTLLKDPASILEDEDFYFSHIQKEIIRSLIRLAPSPSCRETRKLIANADFKSIKEIYNTVFSFTKVTNKELLHYLGIIIQFPHLAIDLDLLVNLRLAAQDKYTTQTIHMYFTLVDMVYEKLNHQQRLKIFYRYIYVFNSRICLEISLFSLFSKILEKDFLSLFIKKQFYLNFPFFKEFIIRFTSVLGNQLIKIGYELPIYRRLIYYCAKEKVSENGLSHLDWIMHRWQISLDYSIPKLFYYFDCSPFLDNLGLMKFQGCDNLVDLIKKDIQNSLLADTNNLPVYEDVHLNTTHDAINTVEKGINENSGKLNENYTFSNNSKTILKNNTETNILQNHSTCAICQSNSEIDHDLSDKVSGWLQAKDQILKSVEKFNKTSILGPEIDISFIRLIPSVDLKVLGAFLCKEKNYEAFIKFANSFKFTDMSLLEALRYFLSSFTLPGESQMISRAIDAFSGAYVVQNYKKQIFESLSDAPSSFNEQLRYDAEELIPFKEKIRKISYGFIVLNTMLYNPSIDKKPTFEEYLNLAEYDENYYKDEENDYFSFDCDALKDFYESIKENEMKIPVCWTDSYEKYLLFKSCLVDLKGCFPFQNIPYPSNFICKTCTTICYRNLFAKSVDSLMTLSPSSFFQICDLLNFEDQFKNYINYNKKDVNRTIEACKLYFENFIADVSLVSILVDTLEKVEKPKGSVLDFKSLFARSSTDLKVTSHSSLFGFAHEIYNMKFSNKDVCNSNLCLLNDYCVDKKSFIKQIIHRLVLSNSALVDSFVDFDISVQMDILAQNASNIDKVSDQAKLKFLVTEFQQGNLSQFYYEIFNKISLINQDTFDAFCLLQQSYDDFDKFFKIEKIGNSQHSDAEMEREISEAIPNDKDKLQSRYANLKNVEKSLINTSSQRISDQSCLNSQLEKLNLENSSETLQTNFKNSTFAYSSPSTHCYFKIEEVFSSFLSSTDNLRKFFNLSNSILNLKFAKKIHKDCCPLENKKYKDFNKLVYLIVKCNGNDKALIEYASCVMNYLSDSLILLIDIYIYIYPVFLQISKDFSSILMKILIKRVKTFCETGISCCEVSQDPMIQNKIKKLMQRLIRDHLIDLNDLKSIPSFIKIKPESFEL